ncbi:MAG: fluoride efflux transporter CrcB [Thermoanaerobaculia bacterium]
MNELRPLLLAGLGGFVGSAGRYLVGGWVHRLVPASLFPWGTLTVNVLGCLLIGLLAGLAELRQLFGADVRTFLLIGLLGGFTTFSSFAWETLALGRDAGLARAFGNIAAQLVLGLAAAWAGLALARIGSA